ncbi:hypothetical protein BSR03_27135, partial [Serratia proteamaculans]
SDGNDPTAEVIALRTLDDQAAADGQATNRVMAEVADSNHVLLANQSVTFLATNDAEIVSPVLTDAGGKATTTLTSTSEGTVKVTAVINASARSTDVTFIEGGSTNPDAVIAGVYIEMNNAVADGVAVNTVAAEVVDGDNRLLANQSVHFEADNGAVIQANPVLTDEYGKAIASLSSLTAGACQVTASINDSAETAVVSFTDESATFVIDSLVSDKDSIVNDGVDTAKLTATVKDEAGATVSGVSVYWTTSLGTLNHKQQVTDENGHSFVKLSDTGDTGTVTVTASLDDGDSAECLITIEAAVGEFMLYERINYEGENTSLDEGHSIFLRTTSGLWDWSSVKTGDDRLFCHTLLNDVDAFDFRTYHDSYHVTDVPDLTALYPSVISAAAVQATVLTTEDVVVRIQLQPDDTTQNVVAVTRQTSPEGLADEYLSSMSNGLQPGGGVLLVLNKNQGLTTWPLQVGIMDTSDGHVDWMITTSLIASWNTQTQCPDVLLDDSAPENWVLQPCQAMQNTGEYVSVLQLTGDGVNMYCSTNAPANQGAFTSIKPTNKIALYGSAGQTVSLALSNSARFKHNNAPTVSFLMGQDGYALFEVYDYEVERVTVTGRAGKQSLSGTMRFNDMIPKGGSMYVNDQTPADNRTPATVYWYDWADTGETSKTVTVSGAAHFTNGSQKMTKPMNSHHAVSFDVFDVVRQNVDVTILEDEAYYSGTLTVKFVPWSTEITSK